MSAAPRVAAVVLAAGTSSRMGGANKLLAPLGGRALVARVVDAALASRAAPVVVVTGHEAERIAAALDGLDVRLAHHPGYAGGLAGSLATGLAALPDGTHGALICLGDMPWVEAAHLDRLIDAFSAPERPICVPVHGGQRGNPLLWPARHFAELGRLEGDVGGRALLPRYADEVREVEMPDGAVRRDVDRPADLEERKG